MIPPLCFITDAQSPRPVVDQAVAAAKGGAAWVQLRDKTATDAEFSQMARRLIPLLAQVGAKLVVNDRVDVAIKVGAPVLHIGQGDGDVASIRRRIGPQMILGLSVGNVDELAKVPDGVDYIGVGPIHATRSKPDHAPPIGHQGFAGLVRATRLPCIAVGGITTADLVAIKAAGGAGVAVVSAISGADDMVGAARALIDAWVHA